MAPIKGTPLNLARRGKVITPRQACEGQENTWVTYFPETHPSNKRGFAFYTAIGDDRNKKKVKLVTLLYGFWYIITYEPEGDRFIIVELWLDLHKHDKYSSLLDGPKKAQSQLDKGLAESQGQSSKIQELLEPSTAESKEEEEPMNAKEEEINQSIRLTPIITTLPT